MDKFKLFSGAVYGKSCYDSDVLKDIFLHGATHADMSIFPIDSHEIISSYDKGGVIDMLFFSNVCYHIYSVVVTCYKNGNSWQEFWQLQRERWTKRETDMIWADLHDKIITDKCRMVSARVYYGELTNFEYYGEKIMCFRTSCFEVGVRDIYTNVSGSLYNSHKRVIRWWKRPHEVGIH